MLAAEVVKDYAQTVMRSGDTPYPELETLMAPLIEHGLADITAEGVPAAQIMLEPLLDMRYRGQSYELTVPFSPTFTADFHTAHARAYGHSEPAMPVEVVNVRLRATGHLPRPPLAPASIQTRQTPAPFESRPVILAAGPAETPFYEGAALQPGHHLTGPAVIVHPDTTIFIESGDMLQVDKYRNLIVGVGNRRGGN